MATRNVHRQHDCHARKRGRHRLMSLLLAALLPAVLGACGDEDGPMEPAEPEFPTGTYEMVVAPGDAPAPFLEGQWTMQLGANGQYDVAHESSGGINGILAVSGDEVTYTDAGGELACVAPVEQGTYQWTVAGESLTFDVVTDGCDGRRFVMTYATWTRP